MGDEMPVQFCDQLACPPVFHKSIQVLPKRVMEVDVADGGEREDRDRCR